MRFDKLGDIIDFAIAKEEEAVAFYTEMAGKVKIDAVATELMKMAAMEEQHKEWLRTSSISLATNTVSVHVQNLKIAEYTVEPEVTPDMTWQDVINLAMHREASAVQLYNSLAELVADESAKEMFGNLAAEEARHKLYFESIWDDEVLTED